MKRMYLYILLSILTTLHAQAQESADRIATEIYRFIAQCDSINTDSCALCADEWIAQLPQEELMTYALQAEKILYPPHSTYCYRVAYRSLLARLLQGDSDDIALLRYKYQYDMLCHNNEGQIARDFVYYDIDGKEHRLCDSHDTRILLIFNDPECEECAALREHIIATDTFAGYAIDSTTTVLLVYPDEPTDEWRNAVEHYPQSWIVGYSEEASDIYDLRTLPSTYLLDENRRILLRDAHRLITTPLSSEEDTTLQAIGLQAEVEK